MEWNQPVGHQSHYNLLQYPWWLKPEEGNTFSSEKMWSSNGSSLTCRRNQFRPCKCLPVKRKLQKCIHEIDPTIPITDTRKEHMKSCKQLQDFMKHCCVQHSYFFWIKKCGVQGCKLCKPPRLPSNVFAKFSFSLISWKLSKRFIPKLLRCLGEKHKREEKVKSYVYMQCSYLWWVLETKIPRCVYSRRRLTKSDCTQLQCYKDVVCRVGEHQHRLAHQCSPCGNFAHTPWCAKLKIIWKGEWGIYGLMGAFMA